MASGRLLSILSSLDEAEEWHKQLYTCCQALPGLPPTVRFPLGFGPYLIYVCEKTGSLNIMINCLVYTQKAGFGQESVI